jgi:hypothetical protein
MKEESNKRYVLAVNEETTRNPDYRWGIGGRIEVYDAYAKDKFPIAEYRFFVPVDVYDRFVELFDGLATDKPINVMMNWDHTVKESSLE